MELDPTLGHEQHGVRPCIAVSDPAVNADQRFPLIAVVPLTGTPGEGALYPALAPGASGLTKTSYVLTDHVRSIDKRRIRRTYGQAEQFFDVHACLADVTQPGSDALLQATAEQPAQLRRRGRQRGRRRFVSRRYNSVRFSLGRSQARVFALAAALLWRLVSATDNERHQRWTAMDSAVVRRSPTPKTDPDADSRRTGSDLVPRRCTLDGFAVEAGATGGLNVREAEPLVPILVATQNSLYRIIPLRWGGSDVLVQGGQFFPEPTRARLAGSTFGGSFLKLHWIAPGMRMEIDAGRSDGPIVTSPVADVSIERDTTPSARPH